MGALMVAKNFEGWSSKKESRSYFESLYAQNFSRGLDASQIKLNSRLNDFMSLKSGVWGSYRALNLEASVEQVFQISNVSWVFPRVASFEPLRNLGRNLEFCKAQGFVKGSFGILEPDRNSTVVSLSEIDGLLIPGVAFGRQGSRLGRGQGYYDRVLQSFLGIKVGICFDFQIPNWKLPEEDHDVRMDFLITDTEIINCRAERSNNG
jgi:5-formyltetrahydrofolate cyclo-ligase